MRYILSGIMVMLWGLLSAQSVVISRYIPGNYLSDNRHRVEFVNSGSKPFSLEGYLLVTRDYSVRMPAEAIIPARGKLILAKNMTAGVNLSLATTPDFLIRFPLLEHEGNYIIFFDPTGKVLEALYFSPVPNVPFLPDRDTLYTYSREKIPFYIPPENRPVWQYFTAGSDPATAFVKQAGVWKMAEAQENPATDYQNVSLRYKEGILALRWTTRFETKSVMHIVEKSDDKEHFFPVDSLESQGDSRDFRQYAYYEEGLKQGETFFYRIKNVDQNGHEIYSRIREVKIEEGQEEFSMEVLPGAGVNAGQLRLRFNSQYSQQVRIKLFDERLLEVAILFDDFVFAGSPSLIKLGQKLPPGNYLLLAETETRRFGQNFEIKE